MGTFDDYIKTASAVFTDSDLAVEVETTSWKRMVAGTLTTLQASIAVQVFRESMHNEMGMLLPVTQIFIAADRIVGGWIVKKDDIVSIAKARGGTAETRTVANIVSSDAGGWMVMLS
jgi:hypothetical protein